MPTLDAEGYPLSNSARKVSRRARLWLCGGGRAACRKRLVGLGAAAACLCVPRDRCASRCAVRSSRPPGQGAPL